MPPRKPSKSNPALLLGRIRQLHVYIAVFIAPTMMFFALTGVLQTFRLADRPDASDLLIKLTHVHRDELFAKPAPRKPPPKPAGAPQAAEPKRPEPAPPRSVQVLKWFFSAVSLAFIVSTLLGLWMALAYHRRRGLLWLVLLVGAAAPVLILALL
jgi:hypothetical protein